MVFLDRTFERRLAVAPLVGAGDLLAVLFEGDERPSGAYGELDGELPLPGDVRGSERRGRHEHCRRDAQRRRAKKLFTHDREL